MRPINRHSLLVIFFSLLLTNCRGANPVSRPTPSPLVPTITQVSYAIPSTEEPRLSQTPVPRSFINIPPLSIDVSNFTEIKRFGNGAVRSMDLSPDGSVIAFAGGVGVWLYNRIDMQLLNHFNGDAGWVHDIAWSPDGSLIASANDNGSVQIWNVKTGEITRTLQQSEEAVLAVSWSPNGSKIVSGGRDNFATVWEWKTGEKSQNLEGLNGGECGSCMAVTALAWSLDENTIAVVTNRNVRIWDLKTDEFLNILSSWAVPDIEWSPDGKYLAVGSDEGIHVLEIGTWKKLYKIYGWFSNISWSPQSDKIAAFITGASQFKENHTFYSTIIKWDLISGTISKRLIEYDQYDLPPYEHGTVQAIGWSPDGQQVIFSGSGIVWAWNANGTLLSYSLYSYFPGTDIALSPDGEYIVTANGLLINADSELDWKFLGIKRSKVAWSPDGQKIVFFAPEGFRILGTKSWSVKWYTEDYQGEKALSWPDHFDVAWAPDSNQIALKRISDSHEVQIELWKFKKDQLVLHGKIPLKGYDFLSTDITWSPDSKLLAFYDKDALLIYDAANLQQVLSLEKYVDCREFNWSPDGKNLAMVCGRSIIKILDSQTWKEYPAIMDATNTISSIDWSPDGQYLVVADYDGHIGIWSVATSRQVNNLQGHTDVVTRIIWSKKGDFIVSSSRDGTIRVWTTSEDN